MKKLLILAILAHISNIQAGNSNSADGMAAHLQAALGGEFNIYSGERILQEKQRSIEHASDSSYKESSLADLEDYARYDKKQKKWSFYSEYNGLSRKEKGDILKSVYMHYVKKNERTVDFYEKLLSCGEAYFKITKNKDLAMNYDMALAAERLYYFSDFDDKMSWLDKALTYFAQSLDEASPEILHVDFLKYYEHLDRLYMHPGTLDLERKHYPQAIKSADILYQSDLERGVWYELYEIRQTYAKATAYEETKEKKDEYKAKLESLPFSQIPYVIAGKRIFCSPAQIVHLQQLKNMVIHFDRNGNIVDVPVEVKPLKILTDAQKERRNKKKAAARKRKNALKHSDVESVRDVEDATLDAEENISDALEEKVEMHDETEPQESSVQTEEIPQVREEIEPKEEFTPEDYETIIANEKTLSLAKKASLKAAPKQETAVAETIEISAQNIWTVKQAYQARVDQEKVYRLLSEIISLPNATIKKDKASYYLQRLSYLLAVNKDDVSHGHVKILGIPFGYHEVHGSHGNDWTIDMVERLKSFTTKVELVFNKIMAS